MDEFEAALAELAQRVAASQGGASGAANAHVQGPAPNSRAHKFWYTTAGYCPSDASTHSFVCSDLLAVSLKDMDANAEFRRFFGARVVQASSSPAPRRGKPAKGTLVQPQHTWPPAGARSGLSVVPHEHERDSDELRGGERWWTVHYDAPYVGDTWRFVEAVKTMGESYRRRTTRADGSDV